MAKIIKNKIMLPWRVNQLILEFTKNLDIRLQLRSHRLLNLAGRKQLNIYLVKSKLCLKTAGMHRGAGQHWISFFIIRSPAPQSKKRFQRAVAAQIGRTSNISGVYYLRYLNPDYTIHSFCLSWELYLKDELQAELAKSPLGRACILRADCQRNSIVSFTILLYPTSKNYMEKINQREFGSVLNATKY